MFRNLRLYRLDSDWPGSEDAVSEALAHAAFEPCGPLTERSSGFVPVAPDAGNALARRVNGADQLLLRSQSRILPPAAINEALEARLDDYRARMGEEPPAREKKRLKAETRDKLLPQAMVKSDRIRGFVDTREKLLGIDTAQEPMAERFIRRLRAGAGDLVIRPLDFREPIVGLLTRIFLGGAPRQFALGRECRMQDAKDSRSVVSWKDFDLDDPSIRDHVAGGMRITHLAVDYDHLLSCVIDEDGRLTKLDFADPGDNESNDDTVAALDADFTLATGALRRLVADLRKALGGYA